MNAFRMSALLADRQDAIRARIAEAKHNHAKRSHLQGDLQHVTLQRLEVECRSHWPVGTILAAFGIAATIIIILLVAGATR